MAARTLLAKVSFWARRYLPAEVAAVLGLLVAAGLGRLWSLAPPGLALVASLTSGVGFYAVLAVGVHREQRRVGAPRPGRRTAFLLVAEFGPSELLDSLLVRPGAMWLALVLLDSDGAALLLGKIVADLVFYTAAGIAFTLTVRTGLREPTATTVKKVA